MGEFDIIRDPTFVGGVTRIFEVPFKRVRADARFDADRFDPKYDAFFAKLRKAGRVVRLGDWLREKPKRGAQPEYDANGDVFVINSQQIHSDQIDMETCSRTTEALVKAKGNKGRIRKYDVLLNSTGYITIGRCQAYLEDAPAVVDSHVTILRPRDGLDPVYLAVFLNSRLGYLQTERAWTGSSGQIELRRESIEEFQVLLADKRVQAAIRQATEDAHAARAQSRALIQRAVEKIEGSVLD